MRKLLAAKPFLKRWSGNRFFLALHRLAGGDDAVASLAQVLLNLSYRRKTVVSGAQARIACTLRLIGLLDPRARIIVFGERIEQADALYEQLAQLYPNQAARYHSEVDKEARRLALERYRHGEIRILVSCGHWMRGLTCPRPTSALSSPPRLWSGSGYSAWAASCAAARARSSRACIISMWRNLWRKPLIL